jgi:hypothetical protein
LGSLAGMRHVRLSVARGSDNAQTRDRVCEGGWDVRDNGWGGVEWSGVERWDSHVRILYARKGGHVLVDGAHAEKTDGWDEERGVAMHQIR